MSSQEPNIHQAVHRTPSLVDKYLQHGRAQRINTDNTIYTALRTRYPDQEISIVPESSCNILAFGASGQVKVTPDPDFNGTHYGPLQWSIYREPQSRLNGSTGNIVKEVLFGKYDVEWEGQKFVLFLVDGRDGSGSYPVVRNNYIIAPHRSNVESLIVAAGLYGVDLHEEIWVYDRSFWQKDAKLYQAIQKASWDNVILDDDMKTDIIKDVSRFFDNQKTYNKLKVPWKRGLIFHGPPGNGKTISIKAIMHTLYDRKTPAPTLYVKTLNG